MLTFKGKLDGKKLGTWDGKETCKLQFMQRKEDGSLALLEIKVPENLPHAQFKKGEEVEFPVEISAMDSKVYYRVASA